MGTSSNVIFLEIIEWFDETGREMALNGKGRQLASGSRPLECTPVSSFVSQNR